MGVTKLFAFLNGRKNTEEHRNKHDTLLVGYLYPCQWGKGGGNTHKTEKQLLQLCTARTAWSESDQAVRVMHSCNSW